tara:strand:- start:178 stop:279 length:102 start_codon:yes stop_codon:yes gene_type:complete
MNKALIMGFESIGRKHAQILSNFLLNSLAGVKV